MSDKPETWDGTAHVRYAYSPRQGANSRGGYHLVLNAPLNSGRLRRDVGDVLCQPNRDFWGLEPRPEVTADCAACVRLAERHGITTVQTYPLPGGGYA
ncbi:hypothetical protein ACH4F6_37940 [Streptomyces sp. NPDC017936]|uniref:hypothetical protein n=1 Tax=Streptomyces sp. NPDC017936 TaxID=3365016 RepID=UPI0037B08645